MRSCTITDLVLTLSITQYHDTHGTSALGNTNSGLYVLQNAVITFAVTYGGSCSVADSGVLGAIYAGATVSLCNLTVECSASFALARLIQSQGLIGCAYSKSSSNPVLLTLSGVSFNYTFTHAGSPNISRKGILDGGDMIYCTLTAENVMVWYQSSVN